MSGPLSLGVTYPGKRPLQEEIMPTRSAWAAITHELRVTSTLSGVESIQYSGY
jgi:hypothetical protein